MHTILQITKNPAGSELLEELPEHADRNRDTVEATARRLTAEDSQGARYKAVMTLRGVTKHTQPTELSIGDLRFLASEVADLDFFASAPEWAIDAIDSIADRRKFTPAYTKHVLSAIRCIKGVNARLTRQVEKHEARTGERKFG